MKSVSIYKEWGAHKKTCQSNDRVTSQQKDSDGWEVGALCRRIHLLVANSS